MSPSLLDFLKHIEHECSYILRIKEGKTRAQLLDDETVSKAIVRSLEIIGEATKNLPEEVTEKYLQVDWKDMARMRDRLIHHYFGIDYEIVFDTILHDIPDLHHELLRIIAIEEKK